MVVDKFFRVFFSVLFPFTLIAAALFAYQTFGMQEDLGYDQRVSALGFIGSVVLSVLLLILIRATHVAVKEREIAYVRAEKEGRDNARRIIAEIEKDIYQSYHLGR